MEHIFCEEPSDYMVTVHKRSAERIREAALEKHLTTNKLAIRAGVDRNVVEGLYYKCRIKLSHLQALCDVVFQGEYKITSGNSFSVMPTSEEK